MYLELAKRLLRKLRILLQSRVFFVISFLCLILYVFVMTKVFDYSSLYTEKNTDFVGHLLDYKIDGDKLSFILKTKEKLQCTYYFDIINEKIKFQNELKVGIKIKVNGILSRPQNNTMPNTFNYKEYLYSKKIFWLINVSRIDIVNNDVSMIYKIKNFFISRINNFDKTKNYLYAFILGDNGFIDHDVYDNFQNNGVTHLFAVSGMHVGLFIIVINTFLKKINCKNSFISYFTIGFFIFYLFLVGFLPSVVRATMFYLLLFLNKRFNWNFKNIKLFYFLFLILLIINPFYIKDIGFIYSFLTSLGLMLFSNKITGNYIMRLLKTSSIAFIFSLPITIYFNYEFNLMTILNNLVVVPIVSLFLFPLSLLTFIFPFLEALLNIGFLLLEVINNFLNTFAINIVVGKVSVIFILIYYLIVYLMYRFKTSYLCFLVLIILCAKYKYYFDGNSYVYFLDVGQGDSTFIITGHQQDVILIDSGGKIEYEKEAWQIRNSSFNLADNIAKFIKSLGISKIDLFIGTHGDVDHIGYAEDLFKIIDVNNIMLNNNQYNSKEKILLDSVSTNVKNEYIGNKLVIRNLNDLISKDENDSSLVLYTEVSDINLLIMGDAPKKVELDIIEKYNLKSDILKVGHHGSNTSSDYNFLKNIDPLLAIISSGRNNRYNHPSLETIENLNKLKINHYNTQDLGTIKFKINKDLRKITFFSP